MDRLFAFNKNRLVQMEPTATIKIGNNYYCPYCGCYSFVVTNTIADNSYKKNEVIGHCCLCKGAMAELDYKKRRLVLLNMHKRQLQLLEERFEEELEFNVDNLIYIKNKESYNNEKNNRINFFNQNDEFKKSFELIL